MKKRTHVLLKKIFIRSSIIILISGLLYIYFKTSFFTINNYKIIGVEEKYKPILENKFKEYDKQKLYRILPGNRVISHHSKDIKSFIKETLPNTEKISVYPVSLHTLNISISSYTPIFKLENGQAITKEGVIYKEINDISNLPTLSYASSSGITANIILQVLEIIPNISVTIFEVRNIFIDEHNDIYIRNENNKNNVILSENSDMKKIWSNIVSAIDTEPLKSKLLNNKKELDYLDTRFGNKVFYKFTNATNTVIIPSHEATTTSSTTISH